MRKISLQPRFDSRTVQSVALLIGSHIKSTDIEAETYAEFVCALGLLWRSGGIEEEMQCTCNVSISDDYRQWDMNWEGHGLERCVI